jgi:hypothetical protein
VGAPKALTVVRLPRTVPTVMGMGGANGPSGDRRRRMVATVIVVAMLLAAGATLLAIVLA